MNQLKPLLYAIILNWNGLDDTLQCLDSLSQSDYANLRLLVVDNASTDGSVDAIRAARPEVPIIANPANLGFGGGNNVGIGYALERGAAYVALLNNDVLVEPGTLSALVAVAGAGVAAVGGKVRFWSEQGRLWAAGSAFGPEVFPLDDGSFDSPSEPSYIVGCCMLMGRSALEEVGPLDPAFFVYFDEYEWCMRAKDAGYRIIYTPAAVAYHKVSATVGGTSPMYHYLFTRSKLRFWERRGIIPPDWRRIKGVAQIWLSESGQVLRRGDRRLLRLRAVTHGVIDYLHGRFGPPPAKL